ncbi:MAG: DoxX family protein [bacterium]|nr:DoxX family protein [bacterium]
MFNSLCKKGSWCTVDAGLLVLRIGVGAIFIYSGWMKVSDLAGTVGFFGTIGFSPFWAYLVSFVELIGGVAVLLGVYTRVAAGLLAIVMLVASYKLLATPQALIAPVSLLFSTIALKLAGAGKYSLLRGKCVCGCTLPCSCGNCSSCTSGSGSEVK